MSYIKKLYTYFIDATLGTTGTQLVAHEAGHNAAKVHVHGTGKYEYGQKGLQSNVGRWIEPTQENTLNIINDATNRNNMNIEEK